MSRVIQELEGEPPGIVWLEQNSEMQDVEARRLSFVTSAMLIRVDAQTLAGVAGGRAHVLRHILCWRCASTP